MDDKYRSGEIVQYDTGEKTGFILSANGRRLYFHQENFYGAVEPVTGMKVAFIMPLIPNKQGRVEITNIVVIEDFDSFLQEKRIQKEKEEKKILERAAEEALILQRERQEAEEVLRLKRECQAEQARSIRFAANEYQRKHIEADRAVRCEANCAKGAGQRKQNWTEFEKIIEQYHIKVLYHFTDRSNRNSIIQQGGLFSWWYCQNNGITIPKPGGNVESRNNDSNRNLQDYVRLSLSPISPMLDKAYREGRIEDPIKLEINPEINYWETTLFSDINATATNAIIGNGLEDFKRINFDVATYQGYSKENKSIFQAEILIRTHIPVQYILNIEQG